MLKKFIFETTAKLMIKDTWYIDQLKDEIRKLDLSDEKEEEFYNFAISGTEKEQEKNLHSIIEPALKELSHEWNGSNVFIAPNMQFGYEKFATDPMEDSFIYVTDSEYSPDLDIPSFTMFVDSETRKYLIDDILEAGDRDFFKNPSVEADYFNLVNFLKSGKLKKSKSVTVYTARPRKDRETIQNLVDKGLFFKNIFVTTSFEEAEGYAYELASSETRDIWYLKIDQKHLIETLNANGVRNYQTFSSKEEYVPIIEGNLI